MTEAVCVVPAGDWTGEGVVWHAGEQALYWVDIQRFLIHRLDPQSGSVRSWIFEQPPVTLGLTDRDDTLLVAMASKIILWQPLNDARVELSRPDDTYPRSRLNDGRPDPAGLFWVGSMQNNVASDGSAIPITDTAAGRLFRVANDGAVTIAKEGIGITNTFCWSPDQTRFYCGDTLTNVISVWDYDRTAATITNERPFFADFERGSPDGSQVDRDGFLWNARYGGGCVVRISPEGQVDRIVETVANPTNCTFGGSDLKTLYITSASGGGDGKNARLAGSLFALPVDVPGIAENRFRVGG